VELRQLDLRNKDRNPQRVGPTAFAGGASDGTAGVAAFQHERDTLRARKAWFFFSNAAVCLGAGIRCDTDNEVVTTLNQCRLHGPIAVGLGSKTETLEEGRHELEARWVFHDNVGYLFDRTTAVVVANESVKGDWRRVTDADYTYSHLRRHVNRKHVNAPVPGFKSGLLVTSKVFTLGLSHGTRPAGASYAYTVLPAADVPTLEKFASDPPCKIAQNTEKTQAVCHPGDAALGLVFYEAGQFEWQEWSAKVDRPCVLLIRRWHDGWHMAVADPAAGAGAVRLDVAWPGGRAHGVNVYLPDGLNAGASVVVRLENGSTGQRR